MFRLTARYQIKSVPASPPAQQPASSRLPTACLLEDLPSDASLLLTSPSRSLQRRACLTMDSCQRVKQQFTGTPSAAAACAKAEPVSNSKGLERLAQHCGGAQLKALCCRSFTLHISSVKKPRAVRQVALYHCAHPVGELSELKSRPDLWRKVCWLSSACYFLLPHPPCEPQRCLIMTFSCNCALQSSGGHLCHP